MKIKTTRQITDKYSMKDLSIEWVKVKDIKRFNKINIEHGINVTVSDLLYEFSKSREDKK